MSTNKAHPSGEWVGYYTYPKAAAKCPMHLTLNFDQNTIEGSGIDNNGQFLIHGTSDELNSRLQLTKQYIGKSAVEYDARFQGEEIVGVWSLTKGGSVLSGEVRLWPLPNELYGDDESLRSILQREIQRKG